VVDIRLKDESSKASVAIGDQTTVDLADPEIAKHLQKIGQWNPGGIDSGRWQTSRDGQWPTRNCFAVTVAGQVDVGRFGQRRVFAMFMPAVFLNPSRE